MFVRTPRPFQWVEASQVRHAVPAELELTIGLQITTLCGTHAVVADRDPNKECPYPECRECDRVWRQIEGIPRLTDA